jgi:hypothetical protein
MEGETTPILYGVELEYHDLRQSGEKFLAILAQFQKDHGISFFFPKTDSSLSNGFEIVSHPFSKKWFYAHQNLFRNLLTLVYENGGKVNSGAGLHIHISRQGLTNKTKAKLFYFINERNNRSFMTQVSGRSNDQYCKYFDSIPLLSLEGMACLEERSGKHEAVNWKHDNTLEVRVFKSTTTSRKLFGRLEFLFSLFDFFRSEKQTTALTEKNYRAFVKQSNYTHIKSLLDEDSEY